VDAARAAIDACTRRGDNVTCDARALSQALFGDHMPTNVIMLGVAWQQGALPVSLEALQEAVRMNGVAVEQNLAALAWGRAAVAAPEIVDAELYPAVPAPTLSVTERRLVDSVTTEPGGLRDLLEIRVPDLVAYQRPAYAHRYVAIVAEAREAEDRLGCSEGRLLTEAVARGLYKLMAYKDEYEVARLHLEALADVSDGSQVTFHLHPPVLREHGLKRKIAIRRGVAVPLFKALYQMRRLRGSVLDPFGRGEVRKVERALIGEYEDHVRVALQAVTAANRDRVLELLELPDVVRGYEKIKLDNIARFRDRAEQLRADILGTANGRAPASHE
jgi:indolepyruvate ferredoxin oxidoreductase